MHTPPDPNPHKTDPLLMALFDKLPSAGCVWPNRERKAWLATFELAADLCYSKQPE